MTPTSHTSSAARISPHFPPFFFDGRALLRIPKHQARSSAHGEVERKLLCTQEVGGGQQLAFPPASMRAASDPEGRPPLRPRGSRRLLLRSLAGARQLTDHSPLSKSLPILACLKFVWANGQWGGGVCGEFGMKSGPLPLSGYCMIPG